MIIHLAITNCFFDTDLGKSIFLYYVLLCRLQDKMPTAFQLSDSFVLFEASGAKEYPSDQCYHQVIPQGTLALVDACMKRPCHAFLRVAQEPEPRAWIIQTECPYQDSRNKWYEPYTVGLYVMNYFSADEIVVLGFVKLHL